ncbi:MAG: rbsR 2 [Paenibacillaceae bacterium]|jgi:LacI family transcriptional regulator|nr:rbsR 2 [Paenibacillaceae bacterium]
MSKLNRGKKTTIYDIADYCQVSPSTVSRVLSGSDYPVSKEQREKIVEAARVLKYVPNMLGKHLKSDRGRDIGVVIPNMSDYYGTLLRGIQHVALAHDSQIILCDSYRDAAKEENNVNLLLQKQVKGILIASIDGDGKVLRQIIDKGMPVVAMEQDVDADCNRTGFNFFAGGAMAAKHLADCGHREVAFVTSPLQRTSRKKVLAGYQQALAERGLAIREEHLYIESYENDDDELYDFMVGKRAAEHFLSLDNPPSAVFCINDIAAIGLIRQLQVRKVAVPGDISVVGFDNIPFSEMITPSLTTIDQSTYDLGRLSADLLFNHVLSENQAAPAHVSLQLEPKLIVRESTATFSGN